MKINELQPRQGKVELVATIVDKGKERTFQKENGAGRVANATVQDETGSIKLSLWNEQIDQVDIGDMISVTNGYVSEFKGEMQLSTGKFGKLEIIKGEKTATQNPTPNPTQNPDKTKEATIVPLTTHTQDHQDKTQKNPEQKKEQNYDDIEYSAKGSDEDAESGNDNPDDFEVEDEFI
jgi:replication factor A1